MSRILIILLTLAAAAVHFKFFIEDPSGGLIYGLTGIGYLGLLGLVYLPFPFLESGLSISLPGARMTWGITPECAERATVGPRASPPGPKLVTPNFGSGSVDVLEILAGVVD